MRQRRFIPSLAQLLAFEAVMRHNSVTLAAQDLSLTQSTVSRLIQSLEDQLGLSLFLRQRKRLVPTTEADAYLVDITKGLDLIQKASMGLQVNPTGGGLSLAVLPTLAARWLAPRLDRFLDGNPGVSVNLSTRIPRIDFQSEPFDAAIYFGSGDWPGVCHQKLFDERLTACAAPDFLARNPVSKAKDMTALPLLRLENRPDSWQDWFAAFGAQDSPGSGMVVDQFSMMIQAAISGIGIALLPHYLAQNEIRDGRLTPILQTAVSASGAYWLVWPETKTNYAPLAKFRDWLHKEKPPYAAA